MFLVEINSLDTIKIVFILITKIIAIYIKFYKIKILKLRFKELFLNFTRFWAKTQVFT